MMKIHTTQDLKPLVQNNSQSANSVSYKDFRLKNYSEQMLMPKLSAEKSILCSSEISFGKKKPSVRDAKKIINSTKKAVGNINKKANPEMKRGDKFLTGPFFNAMLNIAKFETVVQAAIAAVICTIIRPLTIMAIPTQKSKDDNRYASAHSIASGIVGFVATFVLTTPFKMGADYVTRVMLKDLKKGALERLYPQLDTNSIIDSVTGKRKDVADWLNKDKKKFCKEIKDVMKLPEFKQLCDSSEQTFEKVLKCANIDWASQKGKSFNDVVTKDGKKLYDIIDMSRLGIVVKEEGINDAQILLRDLDKEYLKMLVSDAPASSSWSKLDVKSVYDADKNIIDFRQWKDVNGNQWKFDLDTAYVSSPYETASYKPRITGDKTYHERTNEYKFTTYQKNGDKNGGLGTAITKEMLEAEIVNEGHMKCLTWLPDLAFRIPIAATTIALIPIVLKKVFGVEKPKKKKNKSDINEKTQQQNLKEKTVSEQEKVSFKGKGSNDSSWFARIFGKLYGKRLLESDRVANASKTLSKLPGQLTEHMATAGSLITSSVYVQRTITNKDLDSDRRRTLAINQALCFFIPTLVAYFVNSRLKNITKKIEYAYSGWQEHKVDIAKYENKVLDNKEIQKELGTKLKGVRILSSLATFTLIYRYVTPVIITPIANWLGDKINQKKAEKRRMKENLAKEISLNPEINNNQATAKEVSLNNSYRKTA